MKNGISKIFAVLIFAFGLALLLYPTVSNLYNEHQNSLLIENYVESSGNITVDEKQKAIEDARTYNKYLYEPSKLEELGLSYKSMLDMYGNGVMGFLEIPKISVKLAIYHTTDDSVLQSALGHVEESSLPVGGANTHAVLAGHRGLPSAKLLTNIDQLKLGDVFYIHVIDEVLQYTVDDISVVEPEDTSKLKVENGEDYVTLVTCTPYGVNSHRLLVRGSRVNTINRDYTGTVLAVSDDILHINPIYLVPIGLLILAAAVYIFALFRKRTRKKEKIEENSAP